MTLTNFQSVYCVLGVKHVRVEGSQDARALSGIRVANKEAKQINKPPVKNCLADIAWVLIGVMSAPNLSSYALKTKASA